MMAVKDAVHKVQLYLFDGIQDENQLFSAGSLMCCSDYQDVVTERAIAHKCGYPLCANALPADRSRKGRYRISLKEHKVYDLKETYSYCSTSCVVNSRAYAGFLPDDRSSELNPAKVSAILRLFEGVNLDSKEDLGKTSDSCSTLSIQEKTNATKEVSFEEWLGPSGAIEGYVPREQRTKPQHQKVPRKGTESNSKPSQPKDENHIIFNDTDFTSTIITQDEYSVTKSSVSTNTPTSKTSTASKSKEKVKGKKRLSKTSKEPKLSVGSPSDVKSHESNKLNGEEVRIDDIPFSKLTLASGEEDLKGNGSEINEQVCTGKGSESDVVELKPSLKSSNSKKLNRSVTWADEKTVGKSSTLCEYKALDNNSKVSGLEVEGDENSYRLASAEACADALMQVADAVASGKSDVSGAVSEVGLIILPPPRELDESTPQVDDDNEHNSELVTSKWPNKPGEPNFDLFDSEESWFDGPPSGFNLELSPFATMFMALFAWTSSSSLAYIYGRDESFHEAYSSVNGRDYPVKVVAAEDRSSEIKQTLAGCLSRALPGVVRDLRLPTPVSTLEQGMARLLDTMSFMDPLPPFRMKQWQAIVILFLDALSVTRIPSLAPYMTGRRVWLPKVLDGASIMAEEFEIMKDLLIPLGRVPQFSSQCGA